MRLHSHNGVNDERLVALKNTSDPTNLFALHQHSKPLTKERSEDEHLQHLTPDAEV